MQLSRVALVVASLLAACSPLSADEFTQPRTPNVVVIFIDDMGYADIGPFGGDPELTPSLNRLADEGRRFTSFYVSQAVCSASRTSLLTGCYNVRVGIQGALGPSSRIGIHADEVTLGELCRQQGYATACFGKWHLGHHEQFLPLQNGFDEYFGLPYSNDMWPFHPEIQHLPLDERKKRWPDLPLIDGNAIVNPAVSAADQTQLTRQYTDRAVDFIDRHADQPFFVYLPHTMVHVPLFASQEFEGRSGKGLFADVVREVDWSVGRILEALDRNDIADNTLVVFASDNGPWLSYGDHAGSAGLFREGKGTTFEGGVRVPCLMRWPGRIPAGTTCNVPAMTIDVLPTVAELLDARLPEHKIDGRSLVPLLAGGDDTPPPHEALAFYWGRQLQAVRCGEWKLHLTHQYRTLNGRPAGSGGIPSKYEETTLGQSLFNLKSDPGEATDVAGTHPEVVSRLMQIAEVFRAELGDEGRVGSGVRPPGSLAQTGTP